MLVSRDVAVRSLRLHALPTRMNRAAPCCAARSARAASSSRPRTSSRRPRARARSSASCSARSSTWRRKPPLARTALSRCALRRLQLRRRRRGRGSVRGRARFRRGRALAYDGEDGCTMPHDDATGAPRGSIACSACARGPRRGDERARREPIAAGARARPARARGGRGAPRRDPVRPTACASTELARDSALTVRPSRTKTTRSPRGPSDARLPAPTAPRARAARLLAADDDRARGRPRGSPRPASARSPRRHA